MHITKEHDTFKEILFCMLTSCKNIMARKKKVLAYLGVLSQWLETTQKKSHFILSSIFAPKIRLLDVFQINFGFWREYPIDKNEIFWGWISNTVSWGYSRVHKLFNFICHECYQNDEFIRGIFHTGYLGSVFDNTHWREFGYQCPTIHVVRINCNTCQWELLAEIDDWEASLWFQLWVWGDGKCHLRWCRDHREIYFCSRKSHLCPSEWTAKTWDFGSSFPPVWIKRTYDWAAFFFDFLWHDFVVSGTIKCESLRQNVKCSDRLSAFFSSVENPTTIGFTETKIHTLVHMKCI